MTDNTICNLSQNPAVSTAVTLCETNDMATCTNGKSSRVYQFYTNMTVHDSNHCQSVIVIIIITSKKISNLIITFAVK